MQTQVIPYLLEIRKDGVDVLLITFEPDLNSSWTAEQISDMKKEMAQKGIEWHCLAYHKRLSVLATAYDIFAGTLLIRRLIDQGNVDVLHGRVHVPTLMGAIARKFSRHKPKLLFDVRGFFPEEYTDAGVWTENGFIYRTVKRIEKWLLKEADGFVVLTEKAREILFPESAESGFDKNGRPVEVIPCCVDLEGRFAAHDKRKDNAIVKELRLEDRLVFVHVGALGGLYLSEDIADFLAVARNGDRRTFALFLTQTDPQLITPLLIARGFEGTDFYVGRVSPDDVPDYLRASDAGLSFVKAGFATQSRSPTKIPEYLACGLPIISNRGVGDIESLIEKHRVGVLLNGFHATDYELALKELSSLGNISANCSAVARLEFDLETVGGAKYQRIYRSLCD